MEALLAWASGGGLLEDLGINPRVWAVQVVIFLVTFLALSRILFGRALAFMQKREEEVSGAHSAIQRERAEAARLMKEYETRLAAVDKEAYERTQAILKEAIGAAQAAVAKAQADARAEVERATAEIAREKREALARLRTEVGRLTIEVAEKVLEAKLDPSARAVVEKFVSERS
jgi:F-type H+-transporting ATPase subunit b